MVEGSGPVSGSKGAKGKTGNGATAEVSKGEKPKENAGKSATIQGRL